MNNVTVYKKSVSLAVLVLFAATAVLGFSLQLDLRPAQAFWPVIDPTLIATTIAVSAENRVWEFVKAALKAVLITIMANLVVKMMQKLESVHVIRNFLYYSDALGADEYIGRALNKLILKPRTKEEADALDKPEEKNTEALAAKAELNSINSLTPGQITNLAMQSQLSSGKAKVTAFAFVANPAKISKGQNAQLNWNITAEGGVVYVKLKGKEGEETVSFFGSDVVSPDATADYVLTVYEGSRVVDSKCVFVEVAGTSGNRCAGQQGGQGVNKGLTRQQERELLRGGIAMLTSQVACGGEKTAVIRNIALYNAAKARGADPRNIDPSSGNFYTDMYRLGNPFASPDFQELLMRDTAATVEADAKVAINQELTSTGQKGLRGDKNQITRTSQTIADYIMGQINALFGLSTAALNDSFAGQVGVIIGNMITRLIFDSQGKGRVIAENALCGIGTAAATEIYAGALDDLQTDRVGKAFIKVNNKPAVTVKKGDSVRLTWGIEESDPSIARVVVEPLPPGLCPATQSGDCTFPATEDITYSLKVTRRDRSQSQYKAPDRTQIEAQAVVTVYEEPLTPAAPPGGTVGGRSLELNLPAFRIRE